MEKIPFVDYVCDQINQGKFISASTACNYLVYGTVTSGERQEYIDKRNLTCGGVKLEPDVFDPDAFSIRIVSTWFGLRRKIFLTRRTGLHSYTHLTLTDEQKTKIYEAWKVAADIQKQRNMAQEASRKAKYVKLHWWP